MGSWFCFVFFFAVFLGKGGLGEGGKYDRTVLKNSGIARTHIISRKTCTRITVHENSFEEKFFFRLRAYCKIRNLNCMCCTCSARAINEVRHFA